MVQPLSNEEIERIAEQYRQRVSAELRGEEPPIVESPRSIIPTVGPAAEAPGSVGGINWFSVFLISLFAGLVSNAITLLVIYLALRRYVTRAIEDLGF